ncbi:hypothetical protein EYF80_049971 [Liparis tanakae]|uniref:Uncharacterized protein n=1 Tax=Liparis tanakae TaxID=230148 RepID=A0A4Z2FF57_9TELE|nr:hypothetical protein EYF80_049971 [Liparis tanakae]
MPEIPEGRQRHDRGGRSPAAPEINHVVMLNESGDHVENGLSVSVTSHLRSLDSAAGRGGITGPLSAPPHRSPVLPFPSTHPSLAARRRFGFHSLAPTALFISKALTSMSSWVKVSGSSPIMLARCRFPMLNSSTCFWMNSTVNFSGPAAARFFLRSAELPHSCLLRT